MKKSFHKKPEPPPAPVRRNLRGAAAAQQKPVTQRPPKRTDSHRVTEAQPLLPFLIAHWPHAGRKEIKNWLKFASFSVNGLRVTQFDHPLKAGDQVALSGQKFSRPGIRLPSGLVILHEDESIIVVDKPAGLLTIATESERENTTYFKLNAYLRGRDKYTGERIFIVHRLDRDTSGLLVFAKTSPAKTILQDTWEMAEKVYLAVVEGVPAKNADTLKSHLYTTENFRVYSGPASPQAQEAICKYHLLKKSTKRALLEVTLETGRKNQIRVQLADLGHPIVGDEKYGAKTNPARRLGLHSHRLRFQHPITRKTLEFVVPLPPILQGLFAHDPTNASTTSNKARR